MVRALPWMSVNGTTVMNSEFLRSLGRRFRMSKGHIK